VQRYQILKLKFPESAAVVKIERVDPV